MRTSIRTAILGALIGVAASSTGCRGWTSEEPPVHLNWNMDTQEKGKPFRDSDFFADKRMMRTPPEGTVARGYLREDDHFFRGDINGQPASTFPKKFAGNDNDMTRGRERFNIYCSPCHGRTGAANGTVASRLAVKPPSFHDQRLKDMLVGQIFHAITNGVNNGNMPSYAQQIPEQDRWDIVLYLRALQRAQDPNVQIEILADKDTDKDGVIDDEDNCPTVKGTTEFHGCATKQLVTFKDGVIELVDPVTFEGDTANLDKHGQAVLDNLAAVKLAHPETSEIRLNSRVDAPAKEGHEGDAMASAVALGAARTDAVQAYLKSKLHDGEASDGKAAPTEKADDAKGHKKPKTK